MRTLSVDYARSLIALWIICAAAFCGLVPSAGHAQLLNAPAPPERTVVDERGVNLASGNVSVTRKDLSIGGSDGLIHEEYFSGGWQHNHFLHADITYPSEGAQLLTLSLGSKAVTFYWPSGSGGFSPRYDGDKIEISGSNYIYTNKNGDKITFDMSSGGGGWATSIEYPDGRKETLYYKVVNVTSSFGGTLTARRLQSVTSSNGYQLKYTYETNSASESTIYSSWITLTEVRAINNSLEYCNPSADSCSFSYTWPFVKYYGTGSASFVEDALGNVTRYGYRSGYAYNISSIRNPGSATDDVVYTFGYDVGLPDDYVHGVNIGGSTWSYSISRTIYDGMCASPDTFTASVTAPGASSSHTYSGTCSSALLLSETDELGRATAYEYGLALKITKVTLPEGNKHEFIYDNRGNVTQTKMTAKAGSGLAQIITSAVYPSSCTNPKTCNQPTSTTDARGNVTDYTYDSTHGGVLTVTAPAASIGGTRPKTTYGYSPLYAYYKNSSGSIVAGAAPIYKVMSVASCISGSSCAGTVNEQKTSFTYGSAGVANNLLPTSVSSGAGNGSLIATSTMTYDTIGNVLTSDGPLSGSADTIQYRYNAKRQVTGIVSPDPDGGGSLKQRAVRISYNPAGLPSLVEQGTVNGYTDTDWGAFTSLQQQTTIYDGLGRKDRKSLASGGTTYTLTQYSYDSAGRLDCMAIRMNPSVYGSLPGACTASTQGANGPDRITKYGYNSAHQLANVIEAYGQPEQATERTLTYTNNSQLQTITGAENNKTTLVYDGHDRLSKTIYPSTTKGAGSSNSLDYEQLSYDAESNVTARRLRDGSTINFTYDNLNRLAIKDLPSPEYDTTYSYDLLGQMTGASRGDGQSLSFGFDALGRNTSAGSNYGGTTSYQYDLADHRTRITWSDSFYVDYNYLVTGEMSAIRENGASSGVGVLATFGYDDLGRRTSLTRGNGTVTAYGYDAVSRLTTLGQDLSGSGYDFTHGFSYNPADQIMGLTRSNDAYAWIGYVNVNRGYTANGLNQYTLSGATSISYDARGNLTSSGSSSYGYTVENLLKSGPGGVTLAYDPLGRLIRTVGASETRFGYDGADLIAEYNSANALVRRYVYGPRTDEPLVWYEGSGTTNRRWLHADERGSIVAVSDGSGAIISGGLYSYDEYGIPGGAYTGRFQYTGQAWIPELGMYYYKARAYSPTLGRFMQTDPIGYEDGTNIYAYAHNDPINNADPTGTTCSFADTNCPPSNSDTSKDSVLDKDIIVTASCTSGFRLGGCDYGSGSVLTLNTSNGGTSNMGQVQQSNFQLAGVDPRKIGKTARANALRRSLGQCAKYCRWALEAGGLDTNGHPIAAKDYGPLLKRNGFIVVPFKGYAPQIGDVVVFDGNGAHPYGHIAIYDGSAWNSDFRQNSMNPYRSNVPPMTIYRYPD